MMRLTSIQLRRDRVSDWEQYPFSIPSIRSLIELPIRSRICFFVGENGSGKSTLLEAVAENYGFGRQGGGRNFYQKPDEPSNPIAGLARALRLAFTVRTGQGFFLRAESFFNVATLVDTFGSTWAYGGKSLHAQSHGESFLALLTNRFGRKGFYLLDEPEAALSPERQLATLVLLHDLLRDNEDIQFLIASHSPILLAYPGAQIISFDDGALHDVTYEHTSAYQILSRFLSRPHSAVRDLLQTASTEVD
jgi:predicted ATPase